MQLTLDELLKQQGSGMTQAQGWWLVVELGVVAACQLVRLIISR